MDRRTFFKNSSLFISGLSASGMIGSTGKLFAENSSQSFTLSVITDHPDKAISYLQALLNQSKFSNKHIHYTEYVLHGNHISDIAYSRSGRLVDYRKESQVFCSELRHIASELELPRSCENPVLVQFSCDEGIKKPSGIRVFKNNEVIIEKPFPANSESIDINGEKGRVVLELSQDHTLRFAETSCKHKTCMNMGPINQAGQNLVCIPNRIAVTITGTDISGVDSITF